MWAIANWNKVDAGFVGVLVLANNNLISCFPSGVLKSFYMLSIIISSGLVWLDLVWYGSV